MRRICIFIFLTALCLPQYVAAQSFSGVSGETFRQEGIASWYGPEFDGRPTASGEIFNSTLFTAAHPSLPFGTFLVVTNKHNNRQVTVKVNDRGPFVASRIIDLSKAAAEHIDMLITGTAPVIIETMQTSYMQEQGVSVVAAPTPNPAPVSEPVYSPPPPPVPEPPVVVAAPPVTHAEPPAQVPFAPSITVTVYPPPVQPLPNPVQEAPPPAVQQPVQTPLPQEVPPPQVVHQPMQAPPPQVVFAQPPVQAPPQITVILPPPQAPSQPETLPLPPPVSGITFIPAINPLPDRMYRLQVGSFKVPRNAVDVFSKLKEAGLNPAYEQSGDFYRVVLPGIRGTEMQSVASKLERAGFREVMIREEK